jgi:hypothetical protein
MVTGKFAVCLKDFFGYPQSGARGFLEELRALTPQDRLDLAHGLEQTGNYKIENMAELDERKAA